MLSLKDNIYAEKVTFSEVNLTKVFNGSAYFFKFPLSLRREALSLTYRNYQIEGVPGIGDVEIGQTSAKLTFDSVLMNNFAIKYYIEAIHNDNEDITDKEFLNVGLELGL